MVRFALHRILVGIAVALFASVIAFALVHLAGDPASRMAGEGASAADITAIRAQYGFDRPLGLQYLRWIGRALTGDLGESFFFKAPVVEVLGESAWVTARLGALSIAFSLLIGIPLGVLAALHPNRWLDRLALALAVVGQALPSFWLALLLVGVFSLAWPLLPASGSETWKHFVLPTIVLGYLGTPAVMRLTRAGMIGVLSSDYVRTARAKGLPEFQVVVRHALRNALIPVVSVSTVQFGYMLTGSVVVETVFAFHGLGFLAWESIRRGDVPMVQALVLSLSVVYVVLNVLADLANATIDPRMRS